LPHKLNTTVLAVPLGLRGLEVGLPLARRRDLVGVTSFGDERGLDCVCPSLTEDEVVGTGHKRISVLGLMLAAILVLAGPASGLAIGATSSDG
jgi:hypothetical protein